MSSTFYDWSASVPDTVRYHRQALDEILSSIQEGTYCAVLGPRLSGKTVLLRFIEKQFSELLGTPCVYIDLNQVRASTMQGFFGDLIQRTATRLQAISGVDVSNNDLAGASSAVYRAFLGDCVSHLEQDLVLIIEHLEALPTDLVQALLSSLRAAYMDQQTLDYRVIVVISGALSLATLTVGESSPFRGIAHRVFIGDLSEDDSESLIGEHLDAHRIRYTRSALARLLQASSGDPYLIRTLSQRAVELAQAYDPPYLRARNVQRLTREFLRDQVYQYAPLIEAVRLIEEDPDLLRCILILLESELVSKASLPLPLSPDLDPLYLTGVVAQVGEDHYRIQNFIYRCYLERHFNPGRVGHMLTITGRWDTAIDYLEASIHQGEGQAYADLLPATINSIYAAQDLSQAAHFLVRGLQAGFGVRQAGVWYALPQEERLRLIGYYGGEGERDAWSDLEIPLKEDQLEVRAYRQSAALRGQENNGTVLRAIPLAIPGKKAIGVVTIWDEFSIGETESVRERDLRLLGYLNQSARALQAVSIRRQELILAGRMQASLLPESPPAIPGWEFTYAWRPARETSGDFYDFIPLQDDRIGVVIADVVDKGMGAALYMALSRTLIRTFASEHPGEPERVLQATNSRMLADADVGHFVSVFYAILDPLSGELVYCNAGHNPPYILGSQTQPNPQGLVRTGTVLGVSPDASWGRGQIQIEPGDMLILYTDGVVDAQNPQKQPFGEARILEIAQRLRNRDAQDLQDALLSELRAFTGGEPQFDDITLVIISRNS